MLGKYNKTYNLDYYYLQYIKLVKFFFIRTLFLIYFTHTNIYTIYYKYFNFTNCCLPISPV